MSELYVADLMGQRGLELVLIEASQRTRGHHQTELAARVRPHAEIDGPQRLDAQGDCAAVLGTAPDAGSCEQRSQGVTELGLLQPSGTAEGRLSNGTASHEHKA